MFSKNLALNLIAVFLFIVSAGITVIAIRAVMKGEVNYGGGGAAGIRTVFRSADPIYFWIQIGLHIGVAIFFVLLGLMFTGHLPEEFYRELMTKQKHR